MKGVMKMVIQPISRTDYVSHVSFEGKRKKDQNQDSGKSGHQTSAMKAVPVAVFLAMSPLNPSTAAAEYNKQMVSYPTTEVVVQNPQEPEKQKKIHTTHAVKDGKSIFLWGISTDENPKDAEAFLFRYVEELDNNKVAKLSGKFLAVSKELREDGRRLMMYRPQDASGNLSKEYELAYVPSELSLAICLTATAPEAVNNNACGMRPMTSFVRKFGEEAVANAPNLEDCTNIILSKKN